MFLFSNGNKEFTPLFPYCEMILEGDTIMAKINRFFLNSIKRINKPKALLLILLIVLAVLGSLYIRNSWTTTMNETSEKAMNIAKTAETSLNGEMFKKLRAVQEDEGTTAYESIKKRLMDLITINKGIRFAYIYTQRDGKIYFMVDSEPATS